jgi:hypothetical protein
MILISKKNIFMSNETLNFPEQESRQTPKIEWNTEKAQLTSILQKRVIEQLRITEEELGTWLPENAVSMRKMMNSDEFQSLIHNDQINDKDKLDQAHQMLMSVVKAPIRKSNPSSEEQKAA